MKRLAAVVSGALLALACDLGGEVGHDGAYGFLPGATAPATAPRPLNRLLIVEADGSADHTRFYLFTGELGAAGVGLEDLRQIWQRFARFEMHFDAVAENAAGTGGEGGASGEAGSAPAELDGLALLVDRETVPLVPLATADLARLGASRFIGTLDGTEVRGYFGQWPSARRFETLSVGTPEGPLDYLAELGPAELGASQSETGLSLSYGALARPDYVQVDLFQRLVRLSDESVFEAAVGISLSADVPYEATFAVLASAYGQGCWSGDEPLSARLTQVARRYAVENGGDAAVVFRRLDALELDSELWRGTFEEPALSAYCENFRH